MVVEALQKTLLLVNESHSVPVLSAEGRRWAMCEHGVCAARVGGPQGSFEQQGDAAFLCGCRLAVGLAKVLEL